MLKTTEAEVAEMLARAEDLLSQLYQLFADRFSEQSAFFTRMTLDELLHARWVRSLIPAIRDGDVAFRDRRVSPETYVAFCDYLTERLAEVANAPSLTLFAALSIAVDAENTIVEKCFYDVFVGDTAETRHTLRALSTSAGEHAKRVQALWESNRPLG